MKASLAGAAADPRAELERSFEWIHQVSDLNSDTGVLVTHRDHRDTWRHDSDSSGGGEKPWKQNPLNTQTANMPASHSLLLWFLFWSNIFLYSKTVTMPTRQARWKCSIFPKCVIVTINTGQRRVEDMTDGWRSDVIDFEWRQVLLVSVQWICRMLGVLMGPVMSTGHPWIPETPPGLSIWSCFSCASERVVQASVGFSFASCSEVIHEQCSLFSV